MVPPGARSAALLSGLFVGDIPVLMQMKLGIDSSGDVAMQLAVRADNIAISELVHVLFRCMKLEQKLLINNRALVPGL